MGKDLYVPPIAKLLKDPVGEANVKPF